jgi:hypothetical protein
VNAESERMQMEGVGLIFGTIVAFSGGIEENQEKLQSG